MCTTESILHLVDSKFVQLRILIGCNIHRNNSVDLLTQVGEKWKALNSFSFMRLIESPLQSSGFKVRGVEDFYMKQHSPEQYFRFLTQMGWLETFINLSYVRSTESLLHFGRFNVKAAVEKRLDVHYNNGIE